LSDHVIVAAGEYRTVNEACQKIVRVVDHVEPETDLVSKYDIHYQQYKNIYPAVKELFLKLQ